MKHIIPLVSAIILSSCAGTPGKVTLPLPPEPTYPRIKASELECLSDATYEKLMVRDVMKTERIETLRNIIKSTH